MKALTLTQPWASLVAVGAKRIETRSWETNYRGTIAIHAAKGWKPIDREFAVSARVCEALGVAPDVVMAYLTARRGHVLAYVRLTDCIPMQHLPKHDLSENELAFGDFSAGRYAWLLKEPFQIAPLPRKGSLGLWNCNPGPIGSQRGAEGG